MVITGCRLCDGNTVFRFTRDATDGSRVEYRECSSCGSLQTQYPEWVIHGGCDPTLDLDTSRLERVLFHRSVIAALFKICGLSTQTDKLLDWGGGYGLLVRALRDVGIDAYHYDAFQQNVFAVPFDFDEYAFYKIVCAFEVWEHLIQPKKDLQKLFFLCPDILLVSTSRYYGQGPDWPYLGPPKSGHIFFYGDRAFSWIANRFDYKRSLFSAHMAVFHKGQLSEAGTWMLKRLISAPRALEILFALKRKWSRAGQDNENIRAINSGQARK